MNPWVLLLALVAVAVVFVVAPVGAAAFAYYRRPWRLTCPHAVVEAQIKVDATRAAVAAVLGRGSPSIVRCSLWSRLRGCREECLQLPAGEHRSMRRGEAPPRLRSEPDLRMILVPLDGTPGSESVLDAVRGLAAAHRATVRFVHVAPHATTVQSEDDGRVVAFAHQESARVEHQVRAYFSRLAVRLPGVSVGGTVRFGEPLAEIVEEAESVGADLIAMASHRRNALGRLVRGSLAKRLERETTIPLFLVPYGEQAAA